MGGFRRISKILDPKANQQERRNSRKATKSPRFRYFSDFLRSCWFCFASKMLRSHQKVPTQYGRRYLMRGQGRKVGAYDTAPPPYMFDKSGQVREFSGLIACIVVPCFCVKPRQSSSGRLGKEGKRTRGPFSATRASWKLKLDGFSSSRGALQDPHHEKATSSKKPGGRSAAVRRRAWRHLRHFCRSSLSLWWSCFNHYLSEINPSCPPI